MMQLARNILKSRVSFLQFHREICCWSCGKESLKKPPIFCEHCKSIQRPDDSMNYFNILGVDETYDLQDTDLAMKFKNLQKFLHPDKFSTRNEKERKISEEYSSLVNEAYKTLLDPLSRGIYMLRVRGLDLPEKTQLDQQFLMDIMEKNEMVESAQTEEQILKLRKQNRAQIEELAKQASKAFLDGKMDLVIKILSHMKYYTSIESQIKAVIRDKGIIR